MVNVGAMARPLRIQYPGAVYHAMARGNQGRPIFQDDQDRRCFLETLAEACEKTGWQGGWEREDGGWYGVGKAEDGRKEMGADVLMGCGYRPGLFNRLRHCKRSQGG